MRPSEAVAFIARAEAEEKLLAKGWTQGPCKACDGAGSHPISQEAEQLFPVTMIPSRVCDSCGGAKWTWVEPRITKTTL